MGRALAQAAGGQLRLLGVAQGDDVEPLRQHLAARAGDPGAPASWDVVGGSPAEEIVAAASDPPALVCLASHGRSRLASAVLGSTAASVVASAGAPVLVIGPEVGEVPMGERARIVACVDGGPGSERVLPVVAAWANRFGLPVTVVTVAEPVPPVSDDEHRFARRFGPDTDAQAYVEGLARRLADSGVDAEGLALYDAIAVHEGLVDHLRSRPATLVALTTHARTGAARAVLGSVAAKIAATSPAPVLLMR